MAFPEFQTKEVLNKVLNAGKDALNVDLAESVTVTVDSEFPDAAAITDNFANPTTTSAMSMLMGYDGSAWDRVTIGGGTEATALRVTIASNSTGVVTVDGTVSVSGLLADGHAVTIDNADDDEVYVRGSGSAGSPDAGVITVQGIGSGTAQPVSGTFWQSTQPVSNAGLTSLAAAINSDLVDVNITDGTNALVMQPAATEVEDERQNAITSVSTVYGFDSEASAGSQLRALQVAIDNASLSAAPNVLVSGGIYKAALDTYADNDASPLHFDAKGQLLISGDATLGTTTYSETATKGITVGVVRNDTLAALAGTDNEIAPLQVNKSGALYTVEETGQLGSIFENTTTSYSSKQIVAIQFLEDTKFTTLTTDSTIFPGTASGDNGIQIDNNDVFPQGMTIFGKWTAFQLASGSVIAYQGAW